MKRREFSNAMAALGLGLLIGLTAASAVGDPIARAVDEIGKAIPYGEEPDHSSLFVQHIDNAIDRAMMANGANPNSHVKEAIVLLRRARESAYGTHLLHNSREGAALAQKALAQLQAAQ